MASLWTPGGDGSSQDEPPLPPQDRADLERELAAMQQELLGAPVSVVVANHAVGLFQLAALHLNQRPPNLAEGRLAIDAMAALVEGLEGRLDEQEQALRDALAQLRLAYVELAQRDGGAQQE